MPQYYTIEEAAQILGTTPDEVKKMAERNEVRAFRDRGSMRFRCPEVDELARRRGRGSDVDLQLGESTRPKPSDSPAPRKATPKVEPPAEEGSGEVFDFTLSTDDSDQVEIGQELHLSGSSKSGPKSGGKSKSPPPKAGSDSDVRLVPDGSDLDFQVKSDSDVKIVDPAGPKSPSPKKPKTPPPGGRRDSGVHVVPLDTQSDSDVKMVSEHDSNVPLGEHSGKAASDSNVRLVHAEGPGSSKIRKPSTKPPDESMLTEEIDLDAELRKAEEASKGRPGKGKSKVSKPQPQLPTTSPFELSESDLDVPLPEEKGNKPPSSSDFDLTPALPDSSPVEPSSDEMPAASSSPVSDDDEVTLGELSGSGGESGISLRDPADSGISLEQSGSSEEIEFELSLDAGSTPKPKPAAGEADSDSEFELSLDDSSGETPAVGGSGSDSEFELSLDSDAGMAAEGGADSDSEFELTLDDSGGLAPLEEESAEDKDIFETDFEVPALDDESGSGAVALDEESGETDSSDFDLALGDEDIAAEEESGSQVVALDEEGEAEEGRARRPARRGAATLEEDSDEVDQLFDVDEDSELEEEARGRRGVAAAPAPANWGVLPASVMLVSVVVMFLVTLMGFEMIRSMNGYHKPSSLTQAIVANSPWGDDMPKNTP